jgi:hypothetical protein
MAIFFIQDRMVTPLHQRVAATMPTVSLNDKNQDARMKKLERIGARRRKKIAHSEKFVLAKK